MSDLKVDGDALADMRDSLDALIEEFRAASAQRRALRRDVGSDELADTLDDFVGNWDRHRKQLVDGMKALRDMTQGTIEAFDQVEGELVRGLHGPPRRGGHGPMGPR